MLLEQGKSLRNRIQARIKSAKADYIKGQLEHCKNDPKKFWREINALLKPGNSHIIPGFVDQTSGLNVPFLPPLDRTSLRILETIIILITLLLTYLQPTLALVWALS